MIKKYKKQSFDLLSIFILIIMVFSSAYSLESTKWTENLNYVTALAIIGVLIGIMFGLSNYKKKALFYLISLYSLLVLILILIFSGSNGLPWIEKWRNFWNRIFAALQILFSNYPVEDNILFVTFTGILYWFSAFFAGFLLIRQSKPWIPIFLMGVGLIITQFLQPDVFRSDILSGLFFFTTIFLLGRLFYFQSKKNWEEQQAFQDQEIPNHFLRTISIISLILVFLSWGTPLIIDVFTPGTKVNRNFIKQAERTGDFFSNLFASLTSQPIRKEIVYGDVLSLGTSQPLSEEVLFSVITPDENFINRNYYWKARTYSIYENGQWASRDYEEEDNAAINFEIPDLLFETLTGRFIFVANSPLSYFYSPDVTIDVNRPHRVLFDDLGIAGMDIISRKPLIPLKESDAYTTEVYILDPAYEDLEFAGSNYPRQIEERYLQLPSNLPDTITQLALAITDGIDTNFEKALAITDFLRTQISYILEIEEVPEGEDPVEWFLLESKQGFCNYYASAEVLMLRALGIPARLAVGYAQGLTIDAGKVFEIRSRDSHAWPEVYFPDLGWVILEPTTSQPIIRYPRIQTLTTESNIQLGLENSDTFSSTSSGEDFLGLNTSRFEAIEERLQGQEDFLLGVPKLDQRNRNIVIIIIIFSLIGLFAFFAIGKVKYQRRLVSIQEYLVLIIDKKGWQIPDWLVNWSEFRKLSTIQKYFVQVDLFLKYRGYKNLRKFTYKEKTQLLIKIIPSIAEQISIILAELQKEIYSQYPPKFGAAKNAFKIMRKKIFQNIFFDRQSKRKETIQPA